MKNSGDSSEQMTTLNSELKEKNKSVWLFSNECCVAIIHAIGFSRIYTDLHIIAYQYCSYWNITYALKSAVIVR